MSKRKFLFSSIIFLSLVFSANVFASTKVPPAKDWTVTVTDLGNTPASTYTTAITDLSSPENGVLLEYNTNDKLSHYQYDFETKASGKGSLDLLVKFNGFAGWNSPTVKLYIIKNGTEYQSLDVFSDVTYPKGEYDLTLDLEKGDTWGVRTVAHNLDAAGSASGEITVSASFDNDASERWNSTVTDLGSPSGSIYTTSETDLSPSSVLLEYDTNDTWSYYQYDFETTASEKGSLELQVKFKGFAGWNNPTVKLSIIKNGTEYQALDDFYDITYPEGEYDLTLNLAAGDTWGIRAIAYNYDAAGSASGDIRVSAVNDDDSDSSSCFISTMQ